MLFAYVHVAVIKDLVYILHIFFLFLHVNSSFLFLCQFIKKLLFPQALILAH